MDLRFSPHNTHLEDAEQFALHDPQLRRLAKQHYQYDSPLLLQLPTDLPGIYTLGGGRQVGKTTLLKQWMQRLLMKGVLPEAIVFFSGELIDDHHSLLHLLQTHMESMPDDCVRYVLLDEVTYIRDWDKAVKYAADAGWLEDVELILTGSDLILMQEARMRFPGRRGQAATVNFHLYPLSFYEVILLKHKNNPLLLASSTEESAWIDLLFSEFNEYLLHGGYLTAINDMASQGFVSEATLMTYSDWIRGDMLKRGKQEPYLCEILRALIKRYNSQITWNSLAKDLSIDHPKTVADYVALLESMDALFVQSALLEDKLTAAPKKAKKVVFMDPFIFHAIRAWLWPCKDPFKNQMSEIYHDPELASGLVEACVATHYKRFYPTYYIKAEGEVDVAYVHKNKFWPIEVKWTNQLRNKDLKQILKYENGEIFTKNKTSGFMHQTKTTPLPLALWRLGVRHP